MLVKYKSTVEGKIYEEKQALLDAPFRLVWPICLGEFICLLRYHTSIAELI